MFRHQRIAQAPTNRAGLSSRMEKATRNSRGPPAQIKNNPRHAYFYSHSKRLSPPEVALTEGSILKLRVTAMRFRWTGHDEKTRSRHERKNNSVGDGWGMGAATTVYRCGRASAPRRGRVSGKQLCRREGLQETPTEVLAGESEEHFEVWPAENQCSQHVNVSWQTKRTCESRPK